MRTFRLILVATALAALALADLAPPMATAQTGPSIATRLEPVFQCYTELEFDQGIDLASSLLKETDLTDRDRIAIYSLLSMLTYAKGEQYLGRSYSYLDKIAQLGPCTAPLPSDYWPQNLRDQWYRILNNSGMLTCPEPAAYAAGDAAGKDESRAGPRTIAIMEFDNFSTGKYQEKLGYLAKGLASFFEADFAQFSTLRVVERDKIDFIKNEILMTKDGLVDPATAVKVGKLLGAQVMIFGSIVQMDDKEAKMVVKAVDVETSRILTFAERSGKPDFFHMQEEMVIELAQNLEPLLQRDELKALKTNGTPNETAAELYSQGLYYMDKYEYAKAYDFFSQAYKLDNTFIEAKQKMDVYRPLVMSS